MEVIDLSPCVKCYAFLKVPNLVEETMGPISQNILLLINAEKSVLIENPHGAGEHLSSKRKVHRTREKLQ